VLESITVLKVIVFIVEKERKNAKVVNGRNKKEREES
jgi:hypothetical protein